MRESIGNFALTIRGHIGVLWSNRYTLAGIVALLLWSVDPVLFSNLKELPLFEVLTLIFSFVFVAISLRLTLTHKWRLICQPLSVWIVGTAGIGGNNLCYMYALQTGPPSQIVLIYYVWPILTSIGTILFLKTHKFKRVVISSFIGFLALLVANFKMKMFYFEHKYVPSYLAALGVAIFWSSYVIFSRKKPFPIEMIGMFFGISAVLALGFHARYEIFINPSLLQWCTIFIISLCTQSFAYLAWQQGIKKGNLHFLTSISYINPLIAMLWLILFNFTSFTWQLLVAYLLMAMSGFLAENESL